MHYTSALIAVGFRGPGKTKRLIVGFLVTNQDTGQAEVDHCDDDKSWSRCQVIFHKTELWVYDSKLNRIWHLEQSPNSLQYWWKESPVRRKVTVGSREIWSLFRPEVKISLNSVHYISYVSYVDYRQNIKNEKNHVFTFLKPWTGFKNTPFCSSSVTVEWRG